MRLDAQGNYTSTHHHHHHHSLFQVSMGFYSSLEFVDLSNYWRSGTWDLVDVPARIVNTSNGEINNTYIVYTIKLRRKTLFYTVNLIIPCVMLSLLSIFVFYLPSDAGEKVTLTISIVVALVVFLILVSKILPPTSTTVPLISRYLMFTFVSDIFAVFMSVLVVNWNYRSPRTHTMSKWTKIIFLDVLPRFLFMHRVEHLNNIEDDINSTSSYLEINKYPSENEDAFIQEFPEGTSLDLVSSISTDSEGNSLESASIISRGHFYENLMANCLSAPSGQPSESETNDESSTSSSEKEGVVFFGSLKLRKWKHSPHRIGIRPQKMSIMGQEEDVGSVAQKGDIEREFTLTEAVRAIEYIFECLEEKKKARLVVQEWKYAASVIDRLVLVIFTVVSIVVTLSLLTNAPSLLSPIDQDAVINKYSVFKKT
nr:nicotinic acetylcholine receptor beta 1 subunit [Hymenolepis microstoma]